MVGTNPAIDPYIWYPAGFDADWDFTKCGSSDTIPHVDFYARRSDSLGPLNRFFFTSTDETQDRYYLDDLDNYITAVDEWFHLSIPIGPYYSVDDETRRFRWVDDGGAFDWADVKGLGFFFDCGGFAGDIRLYIDDIHLNGKVIREAYSSADITAKGLEKQRVIRNDVAVDDTIKASDDSGTAAQLAYAELLRRMQSPLVATIQTPLAPTILPGQTVHIHACLKKGYKLMDASALRIDKDFRVKEIRHLIGPLAKYNGFETRWNLTDDVTNSHAFSVPTAYSLLKRYAGALGHAEARNLKGSGIDTLIPRLTIDY